MTPKHKNTKLPWRIEGVSKRIYEGAVIGTAKKTIAIIKIQNASQPTPEEEGNAELIVTAVNEHDELVASLVGVMKHFEWSTSGGPEQKAYDRAAAVLRHLDKIWV